MHPTLRQFIQQFSLISTATLMSVILMAFLSIPFSLGEHPGEPRVMSTDVGIHNT